MKYKNISSSNRAPPKAEVEGSNPFGSANFPAISCTRSARTARERTLLPDTLAARVFATCTARHFPTVFNRAGKPGGRFGR
jgi:hypothetical protein